MDEEQVPTPSPPVAIDEPPREAGSLAREMVHTYGDMIAFYRERLRQARAGEDDDWPPTFQDDPDRVLDISPDEVSWFALSVAAEQDPERFEAAWGRLKTEARAELDSGHRAVKALPCFSGPWEQAQFLAIRQTFIDDWQPRGGIELALIDTMAQAHTVYQMWLARLNLQVMLEGQPGGRRPKREDPWQPPRLEPAAAMEQAAAMADRFNRLFLRSLRSLRDLRRYSPSVVVQGSAQINVAERQVNVNQASGPAGGDVAGKSSLGDLDGMT